MRHKTTSVLSSDWTKNIYAEVTAQLDGGCEFHCTATYNLDTPCHYAVWLPSTMKCYLGTFSAIGNSSFAPIVDASTEPATAPEIFMQLGMDIGGLMTNLSGSPPENSVFKAIHLPGMNGATCSNFCGLYSECLFFATSVDLAYCYLGRLQVK